jgi:HEAT repeats
MKMRTWLTAGVTVMALLGTGGVSFAAPTPDSKRMERAKDYFADEQWARAIPEFRAVADDPKETNRDEALFWLAQSEYESEDYASAIQTIARLEGQYPASRWVRLGRSLRVQIAQRLNLAPVLWAVAAPPAPPAPAAPAVPPTMVAPPAPRASPPRPPMAPPAPAAPPAPPAPAVRIPGFEYFLPPTPFPPDTDLRIEAMNGLLDAHSDEVIPLLREIALDGNNPDEGRRAILVLARSHRPEARTTVIDVARRGPEPARLAAIREMGRFDGAGVTAQLMQVYLTSPTPRIKRQIVSSLGERSDNLSLLRIARVDADPAVRNTAIVTLGRLPDAAPQLRLLYTQAHSESRMAVISALFVSKDEDELIRIAKTEKEPLLRQHARMQLRLLGTPKALKFLEENP